MKIVRTDNFGGDYPNEEFVLFPMHEDAAKEIAAIINKHFSGANQPCYWKIVENDYILAEPFKP